MGRSLLDCTGSYDPDTLKLLIRAFDAASKDIGIADGGAAAEDQRTRLALIILALGHDGVRDEHEIKRTAIAMMNGRDRSAVLQKQKTLTSQMYANRTA